MGFGVGGALMRTRAAGLILVAALVASACAGAGAAPPANSEVLAGGPEYPLFDHSLTWTGDRLIMVGGAGGDMTDGLLVDDPLAWSPADGFEPMAKPPGPVRNGHAALWTGDEVIIWSGTTEPFGVGILTSGAAYDPATDQWRTLADAPEVLAKVNAEAVMVGRMAVFAGGHAPRAEGDALVAVYHLDHDRWSQLVLPGPAAVLAGDDQGAVVAWWEVDDGAGDLGSQPGPPAESQVGLGFIEDDGAGGLTIRPVTVPESLSRPPGIALALVDQRLVVVVTDELGRGGSVSAFTTDLDAEGEPGTWREQPLDGVEAGFGLEPGPPMVEVDGWLALAGSSELYWIDPLTLAVEARSLSTVESCVLSYGDPVAVAGGAVAIGGNCVRVADDGTEIQIFGSRLFRPPPSGDS